MFPEGKDRTRAMTMFLQAFGWDQLIENITSAETTPELLFEFLLTYRSFATGEEFFDALSARFMEGGSDGGKDAANIIRVRYCSRYSTNTSLLRL